MVEKVQPHHDQTGHVKHIENQFRPRLFEPEIGNTI
jgi:hypothetical protein